MIILVVLRTSRNQKDWKCHFNNFEKLKKKFLRRFAPKQRREGGGRNPPLHLGGGVGPPPPLPIPRVKFCQYGHGVGESSATASAAEAEEAVEAVGMAAAEKAENAEREGKAAAALKSAVAVAPQAKVFISATAGRLMPTATAGRAIIGAKYANLASVTSTVSSAIMLISRPRAQGQIT